MKARRIIIIGDAGRGKSTLAAKLSEKLGISHHSTDDYFYEVKFSKPRDRQEASKQISELYEQDKWIVEGGSMWLLERGMSRADLVIYLRHKSFFTQWFLILKRHFQRKEGTLKETLQFMRHVFYKRYGLGYKKGKETLAEFVAPHQAKTITFSSFKEIEKFLESI